MNNKDLIITVSLNHLLCLQGKHLRCSNANEVKSVLLPLGDKNNNYSLSVVVTVKNGHEKVSTAVTAQVRQLPVITYLRAGGLEEFKLEHCPLDVLTFLFL